MDPGGGAGELAGRVAVVTGAENPLGDCAARALWAAGASVGLLGGGEGAEALAGELSGRVRAAPCALDSRQEVGVALDAVAEDLGPVGVFVHAALPPAALERLPLSETPDARFAEVWEAGMRSAIACLQAVHPHLRERGGRVVVVVPTLAMSGEEGLAPWAATAEGVRLLAKSLARQWGADHVTVNCVASSAEAMGGSDGDPSRTSLANVALEGSGSLLHDVGPVVVFLAGSASAYLTGATLCLDGGVWMAP